MRRAGELLGKLAAPTTVWRSSNGTRGSGGGASAWLLCPGTTVSTDRGRRGSPSLPAEDYVCTDCGFSYPDTRVERVLQDLELLPVEVRAAVAVVPPERLHRRATEGTWSVLEYVCHLRDVYITSTVRLHRAVTEDRPVLGPMLNDVRAQRFRYNESDIESVLEELDAAVGGFCDEAATVDLRIGILVRVLPRCWHDSTLWRVGSLHQARGGSATGRLRRYRDPCAPMRSRQNRAGVWRR